MPSETFDLSEVISFTSSSRIRSALMLCNVPLIICAASVVVSSISKPSCALNLTALSMVKCIRQIFFWSRLHLMDLFKDLILQYGSTSPFSSLYAIALIVKSLRFRSSLRSAVKVTSFGCLLSSYSPSILYVVTSYEFGLVRCLSWLPQAYFPDR